MATERMNVLQDWSGSAQITATVGTSVLVDNKNSIPVYWAIGDAATPSPVSKNADAHELPAGETYALELVAGEHLFISCSAADKIVVVTHGGV